MKRNDQLYQKMLKQMERRCPQIDLQASNACSHLPAAISLLLWSSRAKKWNDMKITEVCTCLLLG